MASVEDIIKYSQIFCTKIMLKFIFWIYFVIWYIKCEYTDKYGKMMELVLATVVLGLDSFI